MSPATRARVRRRARNRCEYCQLKQEDSPLAQLHVEHIIPRVHGGGDELSNLAFACIDCNLHKGTISPALTLRRGRLLNSFIRGVIAGNSILNGVEFTFLGERELAEPPCEC